MEEPLFAPMPDGGHIAYTVRGAGAPLLLVRPLGGSMLSWDRFADALAAHVRVIAFDARGTGASSALRFPTTTRGMAREARLLLGHLGIARTHVYGISLGGMVASWLAIDAPDAVGRLVLASTLPRGTEVSVRALSRGLALARCLMQSAADAEACIATRILSSAFRASRPDEVRRIQDLARARPSTRRGILGLIGAAATHDVRARLHRIAAPTLVLAGAHDPVINGASQREMLAAIRAVAFEILAGVGHDLSAEAPEGTAARVLAFLKRDDPRAVVR